MGPNEYIYSVTSTKPVLSISHSRNKDITQKEDQSKKTQHIIKESTTTIQQSEKILTTEASSTTKLYTLLHPSLVEKLDTITNVEKKTYQSQFNNVEFASHITKTTLRNSASDTSMTYKSEIGYPTNVIPSKLDQQFDESITADLMKTLSKTTNLVISKMITETMSKLDLSTKLKENNNPIGEQKPKTTIQNLITNNIVSGTVVSK